MNGKTLYLAFGEIDDSLIEEANAPAVARPFFRPVFAAMAACVCLMVSAWLFISARDVVIYNSLPVPPAVKIAAQGELIPMTDAEMSSYYGIALPYTIGGLAKQEIGFFSRYEDFSGNVTYDVNAVRYGSSDGLRALSVSLTKTGFPALSQSNAVRRSVLNGTSVLLAVADERNPNAGLWAEFQRGETAVRVTASGFTEAEFTNVIREIAKL